MDKDFKGTALERELAELEATEGRIFVEDVEKRIDPETDKRLRDIREKIDYVKYAIDYERGLIPKEDFMSKEEKLSETEYFKKSR